MDDYLIDNNVYTKMFMATIKNQPYMAPYLYYMHKRARIKYNFQGTIGEQGSGKSYWALLQALLLDPTFTKDRIIFSSINFLDALDMLEDRSLKGRVILWDDAGVGLPSSEWYAISNKVIQLVMQTVRTLHPTINFTMPDVSFIDAKQRHSLTSLIDCARNKENETKMRIYTLKRLRLIGKTIHRRFVFGLGMVKIKYGYVNIEHCSFDQLPEIFKDYEKIQRKFKYDTRSKLKDLLEGVQEKSLVTDAIDDFSTASLSSMERRLVYEVYKNVWKKDREYMNKSRRIDIDKVMMNHSVSRKIARQVRTFHDNKLMPEQVKTELDL